MQLIPDKFRAKFTTQIVGFCRSPFFYFLWLLYVSMIGISIVAAIISAITFGVLLLLSGPFAIITAAFAGQWAIYLFLTMVGVGLLVSIGSSVLGLIGTKRSVMEAFDVKVFSPDSDPAQMVRDLAQASGLEVPPIIGVYEADEVNAFAAGANAKDAVIAFSSGLLSQLSEQSVQAVAAHEVAHIANKDMVRMQIARSMQKGMVAGFFFSPLKAFMRKTAFVFSELMLLRLSRRREYAADKLAGELVGAANMQDALRAVQTAPEASPPKGTAPFKMLKIGGRADSIFATHPSMRNRIQALEKPRQSIDPGIAHPHIAALLSIIAVHLSFALGATQWYSILAVAALILVPIGFCTHLLGKQRELINVVLFAALGMTSIVVVVFGIGVAAILLNLDFLMTSPLITLLMVMPLEYYLMVKMVRWVGPFAVRWTNRGIDAFFEDAKGQSPAMQLTAYSARLKDWVMATIRSSR